MTQKELLYVEDAIMHEDSIISILGDAINNVNDEEIQAYLEKEIDNHEGVKNNLMSKLEEKANE